MGLTKPQKGGEQVERAKRGFEVYKMFTKFTGI
jgi:hypothetical protein